MNLFERAEINFRHEDGQDYADIIAVAVDGGKGNV